MLTLRARANEESKERLDPTMTVWKLKALHEFEATLDENLDDFICKADYSHELAVLQRAFDNRY